MSAKRIIKGIIFAVVDYVTLYEIPKYFLSVLAAQRIYLPLFDLDLLFKLATVVAALTFIGNAVGKKPGAVVDTIKLVPRLLYTIELFGMISLIETVQVVEGVEVTVTISVEFGWIYWATIISIVLGTIRGILGKLYEAVKEEEKKREESAIIELKF